MNNKLFNIFGMITMTCGVGAIIVSTIGLVRGLRKYR